MKKRRRDKSWPGLTDEEAREFERLKDMTLKECGAEGWHRYNALAYRVLDAILKDANEMEDR